MTVTAVGFSGPTWVQYPGNGAATAFNIPFLITAATDLAVGFVVGGVYTLQVTGFTLQVVYPGIGTVTFSTAPPTGTTVDLRSQIPETQPTNFSNLGGYYPENTTNSVDRLTRLITDLYRLTYLFGVHGPDQENTPWTALPAAASRANGLLAFDANGLPTIGVQNSGTLLTQTQFNSFLTTAPTGGVQTTAEALAGVTPTNYAANPGNITRYGASVSLSDNSTAINQALLVSSFGGPAANIPGGTWNITAPLVAPGGSSMTGAGKASVIQVATGVDGLQLTSSDNGIVPQPRYFRDFRIVGTLSGTTNAAHGIYVNAGVISHTKFDNLAVLNFQFGAYVQGLYYSVFFHCFFQNCWNGIYFNNQSVNVSILDCYEQFVSAGTLITGPGASTGISVQGAPEVEGLHIQGGSIYGFAFNFISGLIFQCQIEAVDISESSVCPIYFTSTIGGLVIRDCWIELGINATGTWNVGNPGNLTGIFVTAVSPSAFSNVHIRGNFITSDNALSGSTGIYLGNGNQGISVVDNHIGGFDTGIGGGNTTVNNGGALTGATITGNTINTTSIGVVLNGGVSFEIKLGPNYITAPTPYQFTGGAPISMDYSQPNAPMNGTAGFSSATAAVVTFTNPLPFANYQVSLGGNAAGYCWVVAKTVNGFTINCSASNSNAVDWQVTA